MSCMTHKAVSQRYCPRFGQTAVKMGLITAEQLKQALAEQVDDELAGRRHRLLGSILFECNWLTAEQIETVLNTLLRQLREEQQASAAAEGSADEQGAFSGPHRDAAP